MRIAAKKITALFLAFCMIAAAGALAALPVHAAGDITMEYVSGVVSTTDGGTAMMQVNLTNNGASDQTVTVTASVADKDSSCVSISKPVQTTTVEPGNKKGLQYTVYAQGAAEGFYTITFTSSASDTATGTLRIQQEVSGGVIDTPVERTYHPLIKIEHSLGIDDKIYANVPNTLSVNLSNAGDCALRALEVTVSMPDGISLDNEGTTQNIARLDASRKTSASFSLIADGDVETRNYPVTITVKGQDPGGTFHTFENTVYLPVVNDQVGGKVKDIEVSNITVPSGIAFGDTFDVSFTVTNKGIHAIENIQVALDAPGELLNKTQNIFVVPKLHAGESKTYSITYFTEGEQDSAKTFALKATVSSLDGKDSSTASQYAAVFLEGAVGGFGESQNPRIMVDQYAYGDASVKAGTQFTLDLSLRNTSDRKLGNIKVSLSSADGAFVPVNSSNSFYVESIGARSSISKSIVLSVNPAAEQKTTAINVSMSYEDANGESFTAEDTISIPVTQDTRLVVDDVMPPWECYVGNSSYAEVAFYNMGKTVLRNLKIDAQGDFDIMESNSYYVGNMESGRKDDYSFTFVPRQPGPVNGTIIFTYEDPNGMEQVQEVAFTFEAMEMPVWEDPFMNEMPMEPEKTIPWKLIIIIVVVAAAVVSTVVILRHRKKKAHAALELADAMEDMDIGDGDEEAEKR
ncbi:MAG: hypothetical protein E7224_01165 [Clostridiales bacterium]|nr:hypothetical protein [Clostridiales bacterium]